MKNSKTYIVAILLLFLGCSKSQITPSADDDYNLIGTTPIPGSVMKKMEGIYTLSDGSTDLGSQFVCKTSKARVSFFSDLNGIFFILKYGYNPADGSIQFSGFWRYSETPTQGTIHFSISAADGASDLLEGIISNLKLVGTFSDQSISLHYERAFSEYATNNPFLVFGHHGVQTVSNPPYAENSINGVLNDENYGCNAVEFDVRINQRSRSDLHS